MRLFCLILTCCIQVVVCNAQQERNLLQQVARPGLLEMQFVAHPASVSRFSYTNRTYWDNLAPAYRTQLIWAGETALSYTWQVVPAMTYLDFVRTGERYVMEDIFNANLDAIKKLLFAELAEGKKRFVPQLINGVWALCDISSWSISASLGLQKKGAGLPDVHEPILELGAGITSNVMAWVYYLMKDNFDTYSPLVSSRLYEEIQRRILIPYYERSDFWWMALDGKKRMVNNWNVWLNYNVLTCLLLVEKDRQQQIKGIYKTIRSVDQFINYYKNDGGCEEGPDYWSHAGGMLYNYLDLLQSCTGGAIDLFKDPLIQRIGTYIGKAYIDGDYYVNYADAGARLQPDPGLIFSFGSAIGDSSLIKFGSFLAHRQGWNEEVPATTVYGGLRNLATINSILSVKGEAPYYRESWLPETGIAIARDQANSPEGFYFSALAGHNDESHNHNDVGTCVLFYNGQPVLIDVGNETYNKKTFSNERYTIWTMRSLYHNVPFINGQEQGFGRQYAATDTRFSAKGKEAIFTTRIEKAYPATAKVKTWERSYHLKRKQFFTIKDRYELEEQQGNSALHFMTSATVHFIKKGLLELHTNNQKLQVNYDPALLEFSRESITVTDKKLLKSWPDTLTRIRFTLLTKNKTGKHEVNIRPIVH